VSLEINGRKKIWNIQISGIQEHVPNYCGRAQHILRYRQANVACPEFGYHL